MQRSFVTLRVVQVLAVWLICQTTISILLTFRDYFPPNFRAGFLLGRNSYFFGPYQWAFYAHILSSPFALVSGLVLINDAIRRRHPTLHRNLGRVQVACVLFLVAPSGLWMAWYAATGAVAGLGFAALAVTTGVCAAKGWQTAKQRRFDRHRCWMLRCFVLLCSAVVLRVIGGLSDVLEIYWTYPFAAWISWLLPLFALEFLRLTRQVSFHPRQSSA